MPDNSTNDDTVAWTETLRHRSDPNRVVENGLPRPALPSLAPPVDESRWYGGQVVASGGTHEASYYDVSPLKRPVWKWQIAGYFFLGGLSSGAYLLARAAERAGGDRYRGVARVGTWIALATILPCPALLIDDLGDPKRFHHMLRVFKPTSPMNLGTWLVVGYSGAVAAAALREFHGFCRERAAWRSVNHELKVPGHPRNATQRVPYRVQNGESPQAGAVRLLHDAVGIPLAIGVAGYTGVLLSCTANPLWCKNTWLGPMFSASAISTGAEAISLGLDCCRNGSEPARSHKVLQSIDTAAHAAEAVCLAGLRHSAPDRGKSLRQGSLRKVHRIALGALVASEILKAIPVSHKHRKPLRMLAAAAGLAAGAALRWSMVYAGKAAADDPHSARRVSRRQPSELEAQR